MQTIISWLISVEHRAGNFYRAVAGLMRSDEDFFDFLNDLAEDEAWHFHLMGSAAEYVRERKLAAPAISIDEQTKDQVEGPFIANNGLLKSGNITQKDVIKCIIATEFSEWNHIFLYVVNSLKKEKREFMYAASRMQQHMEEIRSFLYKQDLDQKDANRIRTLPEVWKKRILVVEDDKAILELMKAVLSDSASIETAENGKEALEKVTARHYDAIISDIDMPVMNGIDFFMGAFGIDPEVGSRFIFFSSLGDQDHEDFIRERGLKYLMKPAPLGDIKRMVTEILHSVHTH